MTEKKTPQQPVQPPKPTKPVQRPPAPKKLPGRDTGPKPDKHVEPSEPWPRKKK